jgi:hypothetical protein
VHHTAVAGQAQGGRRRGWHDAPVPRARPLLSTIARGVAAGAVGTLAMDAVWYARYRRGGGQSRFAEWEVTTDVDSWEQAPAPGQMGRKLLELVTGRDVPVERAPAISNTMHWAYGSSWTAVYGALLPRRPLWAGPAFGALVWSSDYVVLPLAGIYEPIWRYDLTTLAKDLSAHLVFGTAADAALRVLLRGT